MKKRLVLLGLAIFLVACGNKQTAVTTTPTTTTTTTTKKEPVIKKVLYDTSEDNEQEETWLEAKDGVLTRIILIQFINNSDVNKMNEEEKNAVLKIARDKLAENEEIKNIKSIEGIKMDYQLIENRVGFIMNIDLEKLDFNDYKQKIGKSVYVDMFGIKARTYDEMPLDKAEKLLEEQGAKKIDEE